METFLFTLLVVGLLICVGVAINVRLYRQGALGAGRFKRIRRSRSFKPAPTGTGTVMIEETVEEISEDEAPV